MKALVYVALTFCLTPAPRAAAADENPLKQANVGDWAEYKLSIAAMNITLPGKLRLSVLAKSDTEATVKTSVTINDQEVNAQEAKVDLTKPFDPTSLSGLPGAAKADVGKVETGKGVEPITLNNKKYECTLTKFKLTAQVGGQDVESDVKIWISKEIPLTGLARMELKSKLTDFSLEFTGSGSKPAAPEKK